MRRFAIFLLLTALLLSGCVATSEGLHSHPARPEKLITQQP